MKRSKQDRELTDEERSLVIAVRHCAGELNDMLQGARRKAQSNAKVFATSGVSALFRAVDSYADMYEKLAIKSREALDRLFSKFSDCEEIRDAQDAIDETEGNWRNFLRNLDKELLHQPPLASDTLPFPISKVSTICRYFITSEFPLIDLQSNKEITLGDFVARNTCVFVTFQPAYWPDTCVRWRHSEIQKAMSDLTQFSLGFVVVTWGRPDLVRSWSKQLHRSIKWPILWDKTGALCRKFGFEVGLEKVWAAENLDFLGCQRAVHARPVERPPADLDWLEWCQIGGEAVIARPVCWDPLVVKTSAPDSDPGNLRRTTHKRPHPRDEDEEEEDAAEADVIDEGNSDDDVVVQSKRDQAAVRDGETKVCLLHQSSFISDLLPSGSIYQAALTAYARSQNITESHVMDRIRQNRRFSTAPESARLQYEATTGLYYDPETFLYYDSARGYFYDSSTHNYYYWSESEHRYIPANTLIQAEIASAHVAQLAAAQAAAARAASEREAAKQAAMRVAAELAEIRAAKNDYAAYVYETCVVPQQEVRSSLPLSSSSGQNIQQRRTTCANHIESSMKSWYPRRQEPLVPYTDEAPPNDSSTPPPPGL